MAGRNSGKMRRTAPVLETLEGRQLLNARMIGPGGKPINQQDYEHYVLQKANGVPLVDRRIAYTTPQGTKVQLTLLGFGSMAGTTVRPDGTLDLVYNNTTSTSKIVGHVHGGTGSAPLGSLRDADVPLGSPSAVGSEPINVVNLKHFNLVPNGFVNIEGGVGTLALASAGTGAQIHISPLPSSTSSTSSSTGSANSVASQVASSGGTAVSGTTAVTTGSNSGIASPVIAISNASATKPKPTGAAVTIPIVNGQPRSVALGNAQIFGFDSVTGNLIRFDTVTGAALQSIPVPGGGSTIAGVGMGRDAGHLVALAGSGDVITAFDAVTGAQVGQFTTDNLASGGLAKVDGIGSSDTRTFLSDSQSGTNGLIQSIDVTASLKTGHAVPIGAPFSPQREFELGGGLTGLAGSNTLYSIGAAHFDPFTPDRVQFGVLGFTPTAAGGAVESARAEIPGNIDAGTPGTFRSSPIAALGSVSGKLAVISGVSNNLNVVQLYSISGSTMTAAGVVGLSDPNRLSGLGESFHPELDGGVLLDVTGNLLNFVGKQATGLTINSSAAINLIQIKQATDTAISGMPLNHVNIPHRKNVLLRSSARGQNGIYTHNGVKIDLTGKTLGVLSQP